MYVVMVLFGRSINISIVRMVQLRPDIGALAKKSNDNALSLVFKIANE